MNTKMYVGNLSFDTTEAELQALFAEHGQVKEIHLPTDQETGRPRGFAFITMDSTEAMNAAIKATSGRDFLGRALTVNEARPREERPAFGGGGRKGGGGGGYGSRQGNDFRGGNRY